MLLKKLFAVSYGRWFFHAFSIFLFLVAAKYLTLEEYGVYGLITAYLIFFEYGAREVVEVLVIRQALNRQYFLSLISIVALLAVVFFQILWLLYFSQSIDLLSSILLISAAVGFWLVAYFRAKLILKERLALISNITIFSALIASFFAVWMLLSGYGLISLIFYQFILAATSLILFAFYSRSSEFVVTSSASILDISKILLSAVLHVVNARGDVFIVTSFVGVSGAGIYVFSKRILQISQDFLIGGVDKIIVSGSIVVKSSFLLFLQFIIFLIFITLSFFCVVFLPSVFGDKWSASVPLIFAMSSGASSAVCCVVLRSQLFKADKFSGVLYSRVFDFFLLVCSVVVVFEYPSLWLVAFIYSIRQAFQYVYLMYLVGESVVVPLLIILIQFSIINLFVWSVYA